MQKLSTGRLIALACALSWASSAGAVTITYSGIQEELHTSAYARAGPNGGNPGVSDLKSDLASALSYSNSIDSTVLDQDQYGASAIASAGAEGIVDLLPESTPLSPFAISVEGFTGSAEAVYGGGRADASSSAQISFLFEVDQVTRFTLFLSVEYGGGYSTVYLYSPDGSVLISLDPDPTGLGGPGYFSVGLSGILDPGGQYRLEANARSGGTFIGAGTASGSSNSAANFHFELETSALPVPSPDAGVLLLPAALTLAAIARRGRVARAKGRTGLDCC